VVESNPSGRAGEARGFLLMRRRLRDTTLLDAGIRARRGLLAASDSDAETPTSPSPLKAMRPDILVVARAGQPEADKNVRAAPISENRYLIGDAASSLRLNLIVDFVDTLSAAGARAARLRKWKQLPSRGWWDTSRRACADAGDSPRHPEAGRWSYGRSGLRNAREGDRLIVLAPEADVEALGPGRLNPMTGRPVRRQPVARCPSLDRCAAGWLRGRGG
jgi:hypothetical protein